MTLVTRGLGKKAVAGVTATLVSFGLGLSPTGVAVQPQPQVITSSATFLQEGILINIPDIREPIVRHVESIVDILLEGTALTSITHVTPLPVELVEPIQTSYRIDRTVEIPSITVTSESSYTDYYKTLQLQEDEAFILGDLLLETGLPTVYLNSYENNIIVTVNLDISENIDGSVKEVRKLQIQEDEELLLFDGFLS